MLFVMTLPATTAQVAIRSCYFLPYATAEPWFRTGHGSSGSRILDPSLSWSPCSRDWRGRCSVMFEASLEFNAGAGGGLARGDLCNSSATNRRDALPGPLGPPVNAVDTTCEMV